MRISASCRRLRLLPLLVAAVAAVSLTGCSSGGEVVAGTRAPSIQQLQEWVDENWDEGPEADAGKKEMLAEHSQREQAQLTAEEEELEGPSQPEGEGEDEGEG
jgi:hypothetical protein